MSGIISAHYRRVGFFFGIIFFILALCCPGVSKAQEWTTSGANIYNTNSGNVGIGTTSPTQLLHLESTGTPVIVLYSSFTGDSANRNWAIRPNHNVWGNLEILQSNAIGGNPVTAGTSRLVISPAGNVGIGTTSPTAKLHVKSPNVNVTAIGGLVANSTFIEGGNGSAASWGTAFAYDNTGALPIIQGVDRADTAARSIAINPYGGNVGIGTTSPTQVLHLENSGTPAIALYSSFTGDGANRNWAIRPSHNVWGNLEILQSNAIGGNPVTAGTSRLVISPVGNVGIGTTTPSAALDVVGNATFSGTVTGGNIQARYQDVAEWVPATLPVSAGTVLILDSERSNYVMPSSHAYDTQVAGVVTETPGILLGEGGEGKVKVATTGRVKVKVDASQMPIRIGDLLVTSDKEGMAMRSESIDMGGIRLHRPGTILGKALESLSEGKGEILVLLTLQ